MTKHVHDGAAWKPVISGGYHIKAPDATLKSVDFAWVHDGTAWRQYYVKAVPVVLTAAVDAWDKVTLSWNSIAEGGTYVLKRGSTVIYSGTNLTFQDTLLMHSTAYSYTVEASMSGVVLSTSTKSATTSAYADLGLSATAASYSQINLSWSAKNGSVDTFELKRGTTVIYTGSGTSKSDTGLSASTAYSYTLTAKRGSTVIKTDTVSATTPARPVSYGTAYSNVGWENTTGWTSSSQRNLGGPNIYVGVGGTFTNLVALVYGKGGVAFRGEPRIDGVAGAQKVYTVGRSHTNWPFNLGFGAGTHSTGVVVGGSDWGTAEWSPWTGQRWDYYCQVNQLDYWYYSSFRDLMELATLHDWMTPQLAEDLETRNTHMLSWSNEEGTAWTRVQIGDTDTGELLLDWVREDHIQLEHAIELQPDWQNWFQRRMQEQE